MSTAPRTTTLIISNDEMKDIIEIVKSLEDSGLLLKGVSKTIQHEAKEQNREFILVEKGINRAGEGIVRADYGSKKVQKAKAKKQDHKNKCAF